MRSDPQTTAFPIILCSGAPVALHKLRPRLETMPVAVVLKPFAIRELEDKLRAALDDDSST